MGHSNYQLTDEQKRVLGTIADSIAIAIEDHCRDHEILDMYDTADGKFDDNKFSAAVWYIGDQLSAY